MAKSYKHNFEQKEKDTDVDNPVLVHLYKIKAGIEIGIVITVEEQCA